MNINIPDKVYKLLVLIGLFCAGYGIYSIEKYEGKYFSKFDTYDQLSDSISISKLRLENELNLIKKASNNLSKVHDVKKPITELDSTISFVRILSGSKNELIVSDSIQKLWLKYSENEFKLKILKKKQSQYNEYLDNESNLKEAYINNYVDIKNFGFIFFIIGTIMWISAAGKKTVIKQDQKIYNHCQSCGKNFSSILKYGTNKNKTKNYGLCIKCYKKGKFRNPNLTKEDVIEEYLTTYKKPYKLIKFFIKNRISGLERWL